MSINGGNPLSSQSLAVFMASSLPTDTPPHLRDPYDAVALFNHACMIAIGFRLIGLGEDHKIGTSCLSTCAARRHRGRANVLPSEASREATNPAPLPREWNATTTSTYAFRYAHTQSSLEYLIKVTRLGNKAVINALGVGDDRVHSLDILVQDFFSLSSFPYTAPSTPDNHNTATVSRALQDLFISAGRLSDLGALYKLRIIQKIAPGLQKEGYEDDSAASATPSTGTDHRRGQSAPVRDPAHAPPQHDPLREDRTPPARPYPFDDPLAAGPRLPFPVGDFPPPGFEDEYEINRPPGRGGIGGERRPLNIGERDLYPQGLGPRDPLRGGPGGFGGGIGGGGMHPTFDDPLFGGAGGAGGIGGYGS